MVVIKYNPINSEYISDKSFVKIMEESGYEKGKRVYQGFYIY